MSERNLKLHKLMCLHNIEKVQVEACQQKLHALRHMHDAHVFSKENKDADLIRQQMHAVLDVQLDHTNRMICIWRELMEIEPDLPADV